MRRPYCSSMTTTSPRAIALPLTSRSAASPARRSSVDDRADAQIERLTDGHVRAADLHAQLHRDLAEAAEVGLAVPLPASGCVRLIELLVLDRLGHGSLLLDGEVWEQHGFDLDVGLRRIAVKDLVLDGGSALRR